VKEKPWWEAAVADQAKYGKLSPEQKKVFIEKTNKGIKLHIGCASIASVIFFILFLCSTYNSWPKGVIIFLGAAFLCSLIYYGISKAVQWWQHG